MKNKIIMIVALLVIAATGYWAFDTVRSRTYTGSDLSFKVGSGHVVATNLSDSPIPVEMRTEGRTSIFRVESAELGLRESATRQGSGRDVYYAVTFDLPPGQATIDVTRGSDVYLIANGGPIRAVVTPLGPEGIRLTLGFATVVILIALYYLSKATQHGWLKLLREKVASRNLRPSTTA